MKRLSVLLATTALVASLAVPAAANYKPSSTADATTAANSASASPRNLPDGDSEFLSKTISDLQKIADDHGGNRAPGTSGQKATVEYIKASLESWGYEVDVTEIGHGSKRRYFITTSTSGGSADRIVMAATNITPPADTPGMNLTGSGTAALLGAARTLKVTRAPHASQVRFVFLGHSENRSRGLWNYFSRHHVNTKNLQSISFVEAVGTKNKEAFVATHLKKANGYTRSFKDQKVKTMPVRGVPRELGFAVRQKVPASYLSNLQQRNGCIGQPCDTIDNVDFGRLAQNARALIGHLWTEAGYFWLSPGGDPDHKVLAPQHVTRLGYGSVSTIELGIKQLAGVPSYQRLRSYNTADGIRVRPERWLLDDENKPMKVELSAQRNAKRGLHQIVVGNPDRTTHRDVAYMVNYHPPFTRPTCSGLSRDNIHLKDQHNYFNLIDVGYCGRKASAESRVGVNIHHAFRGDLKVQLLAPSGKEYTLHEPSFDSAKQLQKTFTVDLSAEDASGRWSLLINDTQELDDGRLKGWFLDLG